MAEIKAICSKCQEMMEVNAEVIKREICTVDLKGKEQSIWLIYYDCPKCSERHFVQVDNEETNCLLNALTMQMKALAMLKKRNAQLSKKRERQVNKLRNDLASSRKNLMIEMQDKMCTNPDGVSFVVRFVI